MKTYTVEVLANGTRSWYLKGVLHREDGPAVEYPSGTRKWYLNGLLHREDGPAIEYANGYLGWALNDEKLTEEEFLSRTAKTIVIDGITYKLVKA